MGRGYGAFGPWAHFTHVNRSTAANIRRSESPANLQGRHVHKSGAKGFLLVTVDGDARAVPEFRPLDVFRWETVAVNATAAESVAGACSNRHRPPPTQSTADGRPLAARLIISCSESVSLCLTSDPERFRADLRGQSGGDVWIEKIKVAPTRTAQTEGADIKRRRRV